MISLLIPVFNEEQSIESTVNRAHDTLQKLGEPFEIVVVNDGSSDNTVQILEQMHIEQLVVINHPRNQGYGASMKTGIRHSKGEHLATTDADGTYPIEEIVPMFKELQANRLDMIVGARTKKGVQIPWNRRPAKAVVNALANTLVGMKIPDTNSGLRIFTRSLAERFMHLYPQGFSFTITITLSALCNNYLVSYYPIDYFKRTGKSTMSAGFNGFKHFVMFLGLIVRIVMYFRPIKFFMWPSVIITLAGIGTIVHTIKMDNNVSDAGLLLFVTGIQVALFGLLAELIARHKHS